MNKTLLTGWILVGMIAGLAAAGGCTSSDSDYAGKHMDPASGHRSSMWKEHGTGKMFYYDENGAKVYVDDAGSSGTAPSTRPGK